MPSDHDVDLCGLCGARIRWTVTAIGRALCVNAAPDPTGNQACYVDGAGTLRSRGLTKERPTTEHAEVLYRPHVADCARPLGRPPHHRVGPRRTGVRPPPRRRP